MAGQHQGGYERVQDDGRHGAELKCMPHADKGRPINTGMGLYVRSLHTHMCTHSHTPAHGPSIAFIL